MTGILIAASILLFVVIGLSIGKHDYKKDEIYETFEERAEFDGFELRVYLACAVMVQNSTLNAGRACMGATRSIVSVGEVD